MRQWSCPSSRIWWSRSARRRCRSTSTTSRRPGCVDSGWGSLRGLNERFDGGAIEFDAEGLMLEARVDQARKDAAFPILLDQRAALRRPEFGRDLDQLVLEHRLLAAGIGQLDG